MPTEPVDIARMGHQFYMFLRNADTYPGISEIYVDRVQNFEPTETVRQDKAYELGRKGPVGASEDPPDFRVVWEENMVKFESALYQAGLDPAVGTTFDLGDLQTNDDIDLYCVAETSAGIAAQEYFFDASAISEWTLTWRVGAPITSRFTREASFGRVYRAGALVHSARTALDNTAPGSINAKDARIFLYTSGCTPAAGDRAYRLQGFDITCRWPIQSVREIGRRAKVGSLSDVPDVSCTFDIQPGDDQPLDRFFNDTGTYLDLNDLEYKDALIRVYDPDGTEGTTVLVSIHLENLKSTGATPIRAQVRGLATSRISADVVKEVTENSGGMICYVGDMA